MMNASTYSDLWTEKGFFERIIFGGLYSCRLNPWGVTGAFLEAVPPLIVDPGHALPGTRSNQPADPA
jgi:hypothetical protein